VHRFCLDWFLGLSYWFNFLNFFYFGRWLYPQIWRYERTLKICLNPSKTGMMTSWLFSLVFAWVNGRQDAVLSGAENSK
jgi:hypothetical protein